MKEFVAKHGYERLTHTDKYRGFHIRHWIKTQRAKYRQGTLPKWLQKELESIPDWTWNPIDDEHRRNLALLQEFVQKRGWEEFHSEIRFRGVNLGTWVWNRRRAFAKGVLQDWLRAELEKIPGWAWSKRMGDILTRKEKQAMEALRRFVAKHGWWKCRADTEFEGSKIGQYVRRWRAGYRQGKLSERHKEAIESIPGWSWESTFRRERHRHVMKLLQDFVAEHGWDNLNRKTQVDGVNLGWWCYIRRLQYKDGELADWLVEELESIPGWSWESTVRRERHRRALKLLHDFVAEQGWDNLNQNTRVDGVNLGRWCYERRRQYKNGELADWLVEELQSVPGWKWSSS